MTSAITVTSIDADYPVAGQDNDSQGFRDNFSQIKTQLTTAGSEITALQANRATTNASTSFNGHDVGQPVLKDWGQKVVAKGSVSGSVACDFDDGNVVTLTTSGNVTITNEIFSYQRHFNSHNRNHRCNISCGARRCRLINCFIRLSRKTVNLCV